MLLGGWGLPLEQQLAIFRERALAQFLPTNNTTKETHSEIAPKRTLNREPAGSSPSKKQKTQQTEKKCGDSHVHSQSKKSVSIGMKCTYSVKHTFKLLINHLYFVYTTGKSNPATVTLTVKQNTRIYDEENDEIFDLRSGSDTDVETDLPARKSSQNDTDNLLDIINQNNAAKPVEIQQNLFTPIRKTNKDGKPRKQYTTTKRNIRTAEAKKPKKRLTLINEEQILQQLSVQCCKRNNCLQKHFCLDTILLIRSRYAAKNEQTRAEFLRRLAEGALCQDVDGSKYFAWKVCGKRICQKATAVVFGCSKKKIIQAQRMCSLDVHKHGKTGLISTPDTWGVD